LKFLERGKQPARLLRIVATTFQSSDDFVLPNHLERPQAIPAHCEGGQRFSIARQLAQQPANREPPEKPGSVQEVVVPDVQNVQSGGAENPMLGLPRNHVAAFFSKPRSDPAVFLVW
jgi:hypothetical protein